MFVLTTDIFNLIINADDQAASAKAFAIAFQTDEKSIMDAVVARIDSEARLGNIASLGETISRYSIPKTVAGLAEKADKLGCTLRVTFKDGEAHIALIDPQAKSKGKKKKGGTNRYFVMGKPLFDEYRSIADAMRKLGGFERILDAVGPGNAHKIDPNRYGAKTSLNAWQALQSFGTDAQKGFITRTQG